MGAVAAGLVIATALKLAGTLRTSAMGWKIGAGFALLTFVAIGVLRWPMVGVVLGLGSAAVAAAWIRVGR